jgi:hypothetical protein
MCMPAMIEATAVHRWIAAKMVVMDVSWRRFRYSTTIEEVFPGYLSGRLYRRNASTCLRSLYVEGVRLKKKERSNDRISFSVQDRNVVDKQSCGGRHSIRRDVSSTGYRELTARDRSIYTLVRRARILGCVVRIIRLIDG